MEISLTRGKVAIIDIQDADLSLTKWHAVKGGRAPNIIWYAERNSSVIEKRERTIHMHREVLERKLGRNLEKSERVDHINHNGLDNRRDNLRIATNQENIRNSRISGATKYSKFKGVTWHVNKMVWQAQINTGGRNMVIGLFRTEIEAARAYDKKAKEVFGSFGCLNFPDE